MSKTDVKAFKDFLNIEMGQSPSSEFVNENGVGVPLLNGPAEFTSKYPIPKQFTTKGNRFAEVNDILFCVRGSTTGRMNIADQQYAIGRGLAAISHNSDKSLFAFVKAILEHNLKGLLGGTMGSVFPNLTKSQLFDFKCIVPKITIQKEINKILSDLDDKIELNNKINDNLEQLAKSIYDYWFVQFDFPDKNGKPYKSSGGKMVYNEELKQEIPEGWKKGTLETISTIIGGSTPSKAIEENFTQENGMPWITPKDLSLNKGNKYITRGEWDVTEKGIKSASLKIMPKNSILLSSRAPIGYLAISRDKVTTNQGFKSFVPKENFSTEFIFYCVKNQIPRIEAYSSGSTFKEVSASTLKSLKISIPDKKIIDAYNQVIKPIFQRQNLLEIENQQLTKTRDWLLPMLMNGQVTVE